jgi:serine/threonine-protein kinase mTOR
VCVCVCVCLLSLTQNVWQAVTSISKVASHLHVISSKQRPRKCTMKGSDGNTYQYLLKGHEDLRQDERVMQLFGLVNTLLQNDRESSRRDLQAKKKSENSAL